MPHHAAAISEPHPDPERTPLLPSQHRYPNGSADRATKKRPLLHRWGRHLTVHISRDWADCVLILCYFITGLLDSASISVWGSFVSMQTGNSVYIGLGLASPTTSTRWIKSGVSVLSFCLGSFLFSRFHRRFSPHRRWVLATSFGIQTALTAVAAALVTIAGPPSSPEEIGWFVLAPIGLVAFQACGQAVVSRALRYNALTSVVLTSVYCDLFSDAGLVALRNVERNQRGAAVVSLLLGAFVGGRFAGSGWGVAGALWTAAVLKVVVVVVWLVWPAEETVEESD